MDRTRCKKCGERISFVLGEKVLVKSVTTESNKVGLCKDCYESESVTA